MRPITTEEMDIAVLTAKETASQIIEKTGKWEPLAFLIARKDRDGKAFDDPAHVALMVPRLTPGTKAKVWKSIRETAAVAEAAQVLFVTEVWYVSRPTGQDLPRGAVADEADRREAVLISLSREDGTNGIWMADIIREGESAKLGEWKWTEDGIEGRAMGLCPPRVNA